MFKFTQFVLCIAVVHRFFNRVQALDKSDLPLYSLPEISYTDLLVADPQTINELTSQLTTVGAVQITDIPKFSTVRKEALENAGECLNKDNNSGKRVMLDGSVRYSAGAATVDGERAHSMSNNCGDKASKLRSLIDAVCRQVFVALDSVSSSPFAVASPPLVMGPDYTSYDKLMNEGSHLEHLHAYFPSKEQKNELPTIDYHTDNGLMIAMTTGYYAHDGTQISSRNGLYLTLADGKKVKAEVSDSSLILLMGEGGQNWLQPVLGKSFRAVPHALIVDLKDGNSRSWFGKMYLPPRNAILPREGMTYEQYHQREIEVQMKAKGDSSMDYIPLACGDAGLMVQNEQCTMTDGSTGLYCWMTCQSVTSLSCGLQAQCVAMGTMTIVDGNYMPAELTCLASSSVSSSKPNTNTNNNKNNHDNNKNSINKLVRTSNLLVSSSSEENNDYCTGVGTSMSMTGFVSIAGENAGSTECVNLLFPEWTLDTPTKFAFACLGVFCLAMFVQYLTIVRGLTKHISEAPARRLAKVFCFGIQVVLSYFLMLVAMTYSAELFSMVVVGSSIGYGLFHTAEPEKERKLSKSGKIGGSSSKKDIMVPADSCCPPEPVDDDDEEKVYEPLEDQLLH